LKFALPQDLSPGVIKLQKSEKVIWRTCGQRLITSPELINSYDKKTSWGNNHGGIDTSAESWKENVVLLSPREKVGFPGKVTLTPEGESDAR
jgi:hypothetical protein